MDVAAVEYMLQLDLLRDLVQLVDVAEGTGFLVMVKVAVNGRHMGEVIDEEIEISETIATTLETTVPEPMLACKEVTLPSTQHLLNAAPCVLFRFGDEIKSDVVNLANIRHYSWRNKRTIE